MTYTVASDALLLYARYIENFGKIVPAIKQGTTTIDRKQLASLYDAGCSLSFLLSGDCEEFNSSQRGRILQCQLNHDREVTHAERLDTILSHLSISICETIPSA